MADRLQEIKDRLDAATPGPWAWRVRISEHAFELRSLADQWIVMSFARWGMSAAQPLFRVARDKFGLEKLNENSPDAQLIANAPELLAWAVEEIERRDAVVEAARAVRDLSCENAPLPCDGCDWCRLRAALDSLDPEPVKEPA